MNNCPLGAGSAEWESHLPGKDAGHGGQPGQSHTAVRICGRRFAAIARVIERWMVLRLAQVGCRSRRCRCGGLAAAGAERSMLLEKEEGETGVLRC